MTFAPLFKSLIAAALIAVAAPAAIAGDIDLNAWKSAVVKEVAKKQKYPRVAQVREIEGKAEVRITVTADGTIKSHEIVRATGQDVLDAEIPKLVERLNPLPALPAGTPEMSLVLPLNWSLN